MSSINQIDDFSTTSIGNAKQAGYGVPSLANTFYRKAGESKVSIYNQAREENPGQDEMSKGHETPSIHTTQMDSQLNRKAENDTRSMYKAMK